MSTPCLTKEKNERDPGPTFLSHFSNAFSLIVEDVEDFHSTGPHLPLLIMQHMPYSGNVCSNRPGIFLFRGWDLDWN
jgi:hypothetical protein